MKRGNFMVSIRNEKFVKYEDNLSVVRVRINVDSADELPETDDFSGKKLTTTMTFPINHR